MSFLQNNEQSSPELRIKAGWLNSAEIQRSSHFEPRAKNEAINLLVDSSSLPS